MTRTSEIDGLGLERRTKKGPSWNCTGTSDSFQAQIGISHKRKMNERGRVALYPPGIFLSPCPSAASNLSWEQGLHCLGTMSHSTPTGTEHREASVARTHVLASASSHIHRAWSASRAAGEHTRPWSWSLFLLWGLWQDWLGLSPHFPAVSFWVPSADSNSPANPPQGPPRAPSAAFLSHSLLLAWPPRTILHEILALQHPNLHLQFRSSFQVPECLLGTRMFDKHIRIPKSKTELIIFPIKPVSPLNIPSLGLWQHHQLSDQVRKQEVSHISGSSLGSLSLQV